MIKQNYTITCPCCHNEYDGPKSLTDRKEADFRVYAAAPALLEFAQHFEGISADEIGDFLYSQGMLTKTHALASSSIKPRDIILSTLGYIGKARARAAIHKATKGQP